MTLCLDVPVASASCSCTSAFPFVHLPFSFKNALYVELEDLAELFKISKQQRQNITLVRVTVLKVLKCLCGAYRMDLKCSEIKSLMHLSILQPTQAQKTLYPWKAQENIWQPSPVSLCGLLTGNSWHVPWFPSWKCDTLACQFSQVISPINFLQWCILFDAIFKIPVFNHVCRSST